MRVSADPFGVSSIRISRHFRFRHCHVNANDRVAIFLPQKISTLPGDNQQMNEQTAVGYF